MGQPAARLTDMHVCPMQTPAVVPIPHVGGPIIGPGAPTVLIGGMPAAVMGDMCVCVGPPDTIMLGSPDVLIGGKPAARMGDSCAHGGTIVLGCPTVLIGGMGFGSLVSVLTDPSLINITLNAMAGAVGSASSSGSPAAGTMSQMVATKQAAAVGKPFVDPCDVCGKG